MNGVYKNIAGMAVCLLLCACAERESLLPDGLIRLGTRADKSTDVRTRASVNDLAGLVAVGDRVGVYGVVTDPADASYAALTAEWDTAPLMNNVRTTKIDATSGMLFWDGDYSYPPEENKRVKFCVYHPYAPVGTGGAVSFESFRCHNRNNGRAANSGGRGDAATGAVRVPPYAENRRQGRLLRHRDTSVGRRNGF